MVPYVGLIRGAVTCMMHRLNLASILFPTYKQCDTFGPKHVLCNESIVSLTLTSLDISANLGERASTPGI